MLGLRRRDDETALTRSMGTETVPWNPWTEFDRLRGSTVDLFSNLPEDAWSRRGVASDAPFSVRALAFLCAGHVLHHIRILKERYLTPR